MPQEFSITRREAIRQVITELDGPAAVNDVVKRVLALWPSQAKNPGAGVRQTIRYEEIGRSVIFLDKQTLVPIHLALQGVTFRIPLSRQEIKRGVLLVYPGFTCFLPDDGSFEKVELLDANDQLIPTRLVTLKQTTKSVFGSHTSERPAFDLSQWYKKNKLKRDDSLIVTIVDWNAKRFRLAPESARARKHHQDEIKHQNQELADLLFETLEAARYEYIWGAEAILTAYARLSDPRGYPGNHWLEVIEQDGRMRWSGSDLRYADSFSPLDRILLGPQEQRVDEVDYTPEQAEQVYRFKAALWYRKGLWRRIEIQGKHSLADFDRELRHAFEHDTSDHLGGFWKRVRRGNSRRFREVDLGSIDPFGGGEAADLTIAGLGLEPGDELKYVYDFGDWIQHQITLEAIDAPEVGARYPRVVAQNKPRYRYCRHCKDEGRKTVATWICIECSDREQEEVLVCEDCLYKHHMDHYADEILY